LFLFRPPRVTQADDWMRGPGCLGCWLLTAAFAIQGSCLDAAYAVRGFNAAVRQAANEHRSTDLIAANVPILAVTCTLAGALTGSLLAVSWLLIAGARSRTREGL
jgi:hypothetical protein